MDEVIPGRLFPTSSLKMKTTSVSLPRPVQGCLAFCTKRNKEGEKKKEQNTSIPELAWRSYENEEKIKG